MCDRMREEYFVLTVSIRHLKNNDDWFHYSRFQRSLPPKTMTMTTWRRLPILDFPFFHVWPDPDFPYADGKSYADVVDMDAMTIVLNNSLNPVCLVSLRLHRICVADHVINVVASQIRCRPPSRMNRNRLRISQNIYAATNSYESHSISSHVLSCIFYWILFGT